MSLDSGEKMKEGIDQEIELIGVDIVQSDIDARCGRLRKYEYRFPELELN